VDVGYITTNVAISRGNALLFLNSFSLGGGFITADLAECLKIQFNEAERLKHKVLLGWQTNSNDVYNLEGDEYMQTYSAKATNEIVNDRIEMICEYIQKCLDNCIYDLPEFLPIYVTGGGLNYMKGVKSILSKKLKRNVELIEPSLPNMNRPDYSSEVGLLNLTLNNEDIFYSMIQ
jgi:cell division protein FtsA